MFIAAKYHVKAFMSSRKRLIPFVIVCVVAGVVAKEAWLYLNQTEAEYGKIPWNGHKILDPIPESLKDISEIKRGNEVKSDITSELDEEIIYGEDQKDADEIRNDINMIDESVTTKFIPFEEFDFREREAELYKKFQNAMVQDDFLANLKFEKWGSNCILPQLDPFHPTIKEKIKTYRGNRQFPCKIANQKLILIENGKLTYDREAIENVYFQDGTLQCSYREILRNVESSDPDNIVKFGPSILFKDGTSVSHIEFLNIFCYGPNGEIIHEDILSQPLIKPYPMAPLPTKKLKVSRQKPYIGFDPSQELPFPKMSVLMYGMDSVSRVNYHRHMPKTDRYVESHFSTVEFMAHHKIGENTLPNLMVLLLGQYYKDVVCGDRAANETSAKGCTTSPLPGVPSNLFFDYKDIVWKHFQANRYYTLFGEDTPHQGLFRRFSRMGFRKVPVDFYYRPMSLYVKDWQTATTDRFCAFGQIEPLDMINYLGKACGPLQAKKRPYFAFTFSNKMTHMKTANLGYLDIPTRTLLTNLSSGANNTIIVLFSDHGNRMDSFRNTFHGAFEERLPLLKFLFPKWFPQKYPTYWKTLKANAKLITSHFDTHRTLLHLSASKGPIVNIAPTSRYGYSLLTPLPPERTCTEAGIPIHHCACNVNKMLNTKDAQVKLYAKALVKFVNDKLSSYKKLCMKWTFKKVLAAKMALITTVQNDTGPDHQNGPSGSTPIIKVPTLTGLNRYLISFVVHPSSAIFEGSITAINGTIEKIEDVTRTNEYGPTAWCIEGEEIKPFCFCKYTKS